jgi:hypothetical protein
MCSGEEPRGCATQDCSPFLGSINRTAAEAEVLILDAVKFIGYYCQINDFSVGGCCDLCKETDGCNVWSYCNSKSGCSSSSTCDKAATAWNDSAASVGENYKKVLNYLHKCTADGLWPYRMCTLMRAAKGVETYSALSMMAEKGKLTRVIEGGLFRGVVAAVRQLQE